MENEFDIEKMSVKEAMDHSFDEIFPEADSNKNISKWNRKNLYSLPIHCFGFYDWFCKDYSLKNKARKLFGHIRSISKSPRFDQSKVRFRFKNNCPCFGGLFDSMSIWAIDDKNYTGHEFTVAFENENTITIYDLDTETQNEVEYVFGSWKEVKDWFMGKDVVNE